MRTNIVLDDKLVSEALRITGIKTRRALVDYSLRELIRRKKQKDITRLFGKIHWEGDLEAMRQDRRFSP
jgi:Arc/MetJ family transcription regulator